MIDLSQLVPIKRQELLQEADRERLAAQARRDRASHASHSPARAARVEPWRAQPLRRRSAVAAVRRALALACRGLANWLEDPQPVRLGG